MMIFWIFTFLPLVVSSLDAGALNNRIGQNKALDPEENMPTPDMIKWWEYPAEIHDVLTDDGYIITIHRIPYGRSSPLTNKTRPVILLMHGLEDASSTWVINLPQQSFGFIAADSGFDVWLGNVRGNTYGKDHIKMNPKDKEFWRFTWDEMVRYDLDAIFKKIEKVTGQRQIYYVGHSQGTLIMFSKLAIDPRFHEKVKRFFALAPVASVKHIKGFLRFLADIYPYFPELLDALGDGEFLPNNWIIKMVSKWVCNNVVGEKICDSVLFLIDGPETSNMNRTRTAVYTSHTPAGTSTENILHWTQMAISGRVQMMDFGSPSKNREHYGRSTPPIYDLTKITGNIHLYSSMADYLADPQDVQEFLVPKLKRDVLKEHVIFQNYSHLDFVWSPSIGIELINNVTFRLEKDVYRPILATIRKLDNLP